MANGEGPWPPSLQAQSENAPKCASSAFRSKQKGQQRRLAEAWQSRCCRFCDCQSLAKLLLHKPGKVAVVVVVIVVVVAVALVVVVVDVVVVVGERATISMDL